MKRPSILVCRLLTFTLIFGLLFPAQAHQAFGQSRRGVRANQSEKGKGMRFELSEPAEGEQSKPQPAPVQTTPLSEGDAAQVLSRLPAVAATAEAEQPFAFRDRSLPPPRAGKVIAASFPASGLPDAPKENSSGPLAVVRFAPEGEVALAPHLSLTFSQPMVAVTSHAELSAQEIPVKLTPAPPGKWRWLGVKTLLFEPSGRFPMATDYAVEVAAGTQSALGGALPAARRWTFSTPPPQVKTTHPTGDAEPRDPLFFVAFDQRVDAAALKTVRLTSGKREWKLRAATDAEVQADERVRELVKSAQPGCWLAFRVAPDSSVNAETPLPAATTFTLTVSPGTPSAEGPRVTAEAQHFKFRTHGTLRFVKRECGYGDGCGPYDDWNIEFSNPLDADAFDQKQIRVEPELPGLKTEIYGNTLRIEGQPKGLTSYRVTLDASIRDEFGQTLGVTPSLIFKVGRSEPGFSGPRQGVQTLDPHGPRSISYYSLNHSGLKVRLHSVSPGDWNSFVRFARSDDRDPVRPPGRKVFSRVVNFNARPEEIAEMRIDLTPALADGVGHAVLIVEPLKQSEYNEERACVWIQATDIGLSAFADNTELACWATSLKDGKPLEGVHLSVLDPKQRDASSLASGVTKADGLAHIPLAARPASLATAQYPRVLVARRGNDTAILMESDSEYHDVFGWYKKGKMDELRWHVFDDRAMYRPGEEVHVKGWLRRVGAGKGGDVGALGDAATSVAWKLKDSRGNQVGAGEIKLNALGGFDTSFKLPDAMNLGHAQLELQAQGGDAALSRQSHTHRFQVQEFRRPEYEVTAEASAGVHFVGGKADVTLRAAYYAGGALPNAEVNWRVTSKPANFTPPGRSNFIFGKWEPWWLSSYDGAESQSETFAGRTDAGGKHRLRVDFISADPPRPSSVTAEASVTDVNRQRWSASAQMLVHPAAHYVGLRAERTFVQQGEPLVVESIVTDLDGRAVANREIRLRAVLLDRTYQKGEWREQETNAQECVITSRAEPVTCRFETKLGGQYRVTATVVDDERRLNQTEMRLWVAGGQRPTQAEVEQEEIELIPDRKEYRDGDTAEILVQAPFYPAEGVMTLRRSGLVRAERFTMNSPSHTLRVPVKDADVPNLHVQVDLVGAAVRENSKGEPDQSLPARPAFASGALNLSIPPLKRRLQVTATPRDKALEPGGGTFVDVEVKDAAGEPVAGGEVAVVVVDEAVLALTNYKLKDPLETFYLKRDEGVSNYHAREDVLLAKPEDVKKKAHPVPSATPAKPVSVSVVGGLFYGRAMGYGGGAAGGTGMSEPIRARIDFDPLATFAASLPTDADGVASVKVKLPDSLTRYRVMAVAVAGGKQFGVAESAITARLPLMVRPSAPRFLNFGDRFELPVVVQNQTDESLTVDVAVRATNASLLEAAARRVTVPANDRVEVRFPATTVKPGQAHFQIAAVAGRFADAAEVKLPVWTPATTEAFATYGELDAGAVTHSVKAPTAAAAEFGGLEITTSSTELQALTDAVLYLSAYPFECAEQLASRVLAVAALRDVLTAFKADGLPAPEDLGGAVARDLKKLAAMQNDDGGFGFWRRGEKSWPFLSIHAAHAMLRAKEKRFDVPPPTLAKARDYLRRIEQRIPAEYGAEARRVLVAYALYVRGLAGERDAAHARRLIAEAGVTNLPLEAAGWLLAVLSGDADSRAEVAALRRHLTNRAEETAATAHFTTAYRDGAHLLLASDRRADAIILDALIADEPQSDLIPKLVRGLLAHRKQGRWSNTQENAFALLALDRYFRTFEKTAPDFVARVWLNDACANEQRFAGRSIDRHQLSVPMSLLIEQPAASNLTLGKEGGGRLYYRVGMKYAPRELNIKAADYGFAVERSYEAVDKADDVRRDADGTWRIRAGASVRVRLAMAAPARRYHVALVDALPAGFEPLNPSLAVTGDAAPDPKEAERQRWWWRSWRWFEHQNLRDERAEVFASLLWEGVYNYSYVARATTPGVFVAPPAKAEEMYQPETFGRSASDRVIVE
jgi:alpha-2-macroglobulin